MRFQPDTALLLTTDPLMSVAEPVWGTGGWLPPEYREALDWLALMRLLGWEVTVAKPGDLAAAAENGPGLKWLVVAMDPAELRPEEVSAIRGLLERRSILLVARAGTGGGEFAALVGIRRVNIDTMGKQIEWMEGGRRKRWRSRELLRLGAVQCDERADLRVTLGGQTVIGGSRLGRGTVVLLGFHPSEARDQSGTVTDLLRFLLLAGSRVPVAAFCWRGTVVLRMDDPGSSEIIHHHVYADCRKLTESEWRAFGRELSSRRASLTIGYVPGWVDDGNEQTSELRVGGKRVPRVPGAVHPSPQVRYRRVTAPGVAVEYDYEAEHAALEGLMHEGLVDLAAHGFTHMDPQLEKWVGAVDQHSHSRWFREFGPAAMRHTRELPLSSQPLNRSLQWIEEHFRTRARVLIFPGEIFTSEALVVALQLQFRLVSSYYLAIRHAEHFCWVQHVCAPYLDQADPSWLDTALPVVAVCHDWDLSRGGLDWFRGCLDRWERAGGRYFMGCEDLVCRLELRLQLIEVGGAFRLRLEGALRRNIRSAMPIELHFPGGRTPAEIEVEMAGEVRLARVTPGLSGSGRVVL